MIIPHLQTRVCYDYIVTGNDYIAIAVNIDNPKDAHYFTPHTKEIDDIEMTAFDRAVGWCFPGI